MIVGFLPRHIFRAAQKTPLRGSKTRLKKPLALLLIILPIVAGLYLAPETISIAHGTAIVGKVCVAHPGDTVCPITAPTIAGPQPTTTFSVPILVDSSDALSGFDITLLTNSSTLMPTDTSVAGSILTGIHELVKCVGAVPKVGTCSSTDTIDTLHYVVSSDFTPTRPVTGLLFTAVYTVKANSAKSPIDFQKGCTRTSVAGGVCVTISGGGNVPDPETAQAAKFSNKGYFDIIPSSATVQVSKGDVPNVSVTLDLPSLNMFIGTVALGVSSAPIGPTVSVIPATTLVAPGSNGFAVLNVTVAKTVASGTYTLNITGTSSPLPQNSVAVQLIVPVPDFTLTPTSPNLIFNVTASGKSNITISSIGNFNGTVTLSLPSKLPTGLSASLLNSTLKLSSKGTNMTKLTVRSTAAGSFTLNVTATSGSLTHTSQLTVVVLDFLLKVKPGTLNVVNGSSDVEPINIQATGFYNVTVRIGNTTFIQQILTSGTTSPSNGISVGCSPNKLLLISTGNTNGLNSTNCTVNAIAVGNYIVTVTAMSGISNRTSFHAISFQVTVIAPSFSLTLPSTVPTVAVGSSTTVKANITSNLGLIDNITITLGISSTGLSPTPTFSQSATVANLTATVTSQTIFITLIAGSTTPPGTYTLTVTGSGKHSRPSLLITSILVVVIQTASPHNLSVYSVTSSATSATVGSDVTITVVVQNLGKVPDNATIIAIIGDQNIGVKNATIAVGGNITETFTWHTGTYNPGAYMVGGKVLGFNLLRSATPVTLNASNTSVFTSPYTIPAIVIAAIIIVVAALAFFYVLPRRKIQSA
jgi:hypothetical protein